jgi:hypothetical protein
MRSKLLLLLWGIIIVFSWGLMGIGVYGGWQSVGERFFGKKKAISVNSQAMKNYFLEVSSENKKTISLKNFYQLMIGKSVINIDSMTWDKDYGWWVPDPREDKAAWYYGDGTDSESTNRILFCDLVLTNVLTKPEIGQAVLFRSENKTEWVIMKVVKQEQLDFKSYRDLIKTLPAGVFAIIDINGNDQNDSGKYLASYLEGV